jgi:uncharacterized protein with FMN-binding domain
MSSKRGTRDTDFLQSIKKFFLSAFVVISFVAYLFHERNTNSTNVSAGNFAPNTSAVPTLTFSASSNTATNTNAFPTVVMPSQATTYKNGTYNGPEVNAYYGLVQVQVVIQNEKIANVQFLDYPHDRRTSREINSQVMPWLTQEAIQAQSANVDLISGATLTSEGFVNSLQAALQSARN